MSSQGVWQVVNKPSGRLIWNRIISGIVKLFPKLPATCVSTMSPLQIDFKTSKTHNPNYSSRSLSRNRAQIVKIDVVAHKEKAGCNRTLGFDRLSVSRPEWRKGDEMHSSNIPLSQSAAGQQFHMIVMCPLDFLVQFPFQVRSAHFFLRPHCSFPRWISLRLELWQQRECTHVIQKGRSERSDSAATTCAECHYEKEKKREKKTVLLTTYQPSAGTDLIPIAVFTLVVYCLCRLQIRWEAGRFRLLI